MKTKKVLAFMLCGTFFFSNMATCVVYADTQTEAEVNTEYPLSGMLAQLGLNNTGVVGWDINYGGNPNGEYLPATGAYYYTNKGSENLAAFAAALSGEAYIDPYFGQLDPIQTIADSQGLTYEQANQLVGVIRNFLNSFDWKNADEMTKAKKAAEFIESAKYTTNGNSFDIHSIYGCLVQKESVCDGFAKSFHLLTRLIGMQSTYIDSFALNHAWNYINVNNTWYRFDAATDYHADDFTDRMKQAATNEMPNHYDQTALQALGFNQ